MSNIIRINPIVKVESFYTVWCYDKFGKLKWEEHFPNIVTTVGLNELLDGVFTAAPAAFLWYVGLKDTGTPVAGDTMASHGSWATISPYSDANDPAWTANGAAASGSMSNSSSKATFAINATDEIFGAFLKNNNTVDSATGLLYGVGDFAASRNVVSGDTLNVQIDLDLTSS